MGMKVWGGPLILDHTVNLGRSNSPQIHHTSVVYYTGWTQMAAQSLVELIKPEKVGISEN